MILAQNIHPWALMASGLTIPTSIIISHKNEVFHGLCAILKGLKTYDPPLIINGGDSFVSRCMEENTALTLFEGINQESVFTTFVFRDQTYHPQTEAETKYFLDYLLSAKKYGLSVYLLEYRATPSLARWIDTYCIYSGFVWYNAGRVELE